MIRDSLSKRTFLVCYGSRNVVDTSLQQNSKKTTRNQKKRTCFYGIFEVGRKWNKRRKKNLIVEVSNKEDEHLQETNMAARFLAENVEFEGWKIHENSNEELGRTCTIYWANPNRICSTLHRTRTHWLSNNQEPYVSSCDIQTTSLKVGKVLKRTKEEKISQSVSLFQIV